VRRADAHRDARRWAEAADDYREVVRRSPGRWPIWVQLGHALKESGRREEALASYRQALALAPDVADTHLQIGHVLKLLGRRDEAVAAYLEAVRADRGCRPAAHELINLGEAWRMPQTAGLAGELLQQTLTALDGMKRSLASLEAQLPALLSLTAIPARHYGVFRSLYRTGPPLPAGPVPDVAVVLVEDSGGADSVLQSLAAVDGQTVRPGEIALLAVSEEAATAYERVRPGLRAAAAAAVVTTHEGCRTALRDLAGRCRSDWLLLVNTSLVLDPHAIAWFGCAIAAADCAAFVGDEDRLQPPAAASDRSAAREDPVFRSAFDPDFGLGGEEPCHAVVARRDLLLERLEAGPLGAGLSDLCSIVMPGGPAQRTIGHVPRVIGSHLGSASPRPTRRAGDTALPPRGAETIRVIIPTRNGHDILKRCIESLKATAASSQLLQIVVVDNGSDDAATLAYLDQAAGRDEFALLREDRPFNWSRLNNLGAGAGTNDGSFLLFSNNDIEMMTRGWDSLLCATLRRPEIGAVGVRLVYPDGTLQHAGIVLGPNGRTEHEGVGAPGDAGGPGERWQRRRRVGAVTGAFLACRSADFSESGGFDEVHLPIWFNDIDFCLRLRSRGLQILYEPAILACHFESKTVKTAFCDGQRDRYWQAALQAMNQRWGHWLTWDAGYNPHYDRAGEPFRALREPSAEVLLRYLRLANRPNPWLIG
jgi:GT2 family glycosyltransferase